MSFKKNLRVLDILMHVALLCPIAARRVRIESTACWDGDIGCFLHRLHDVLECGKTLVLTPEEAHALLDSIDVLTAVGLRGRALSSVMV